MSQQTDTEFITVYGNDDGSNYDNINKKTKKKVHTTLKMIEI